MNAGGAAPLDLVILTGASRGLGAALARQLLAPGLRMLAVSRSSDPELDAAAAAAAAQVEQSVQDLADAPAAAALAADWLARQPAERVRSATLVNNAAALAAPGPVEIDTDAAHSRAVRVGLEAPILLTAAFIRATRNWRADRRVLLISSGAGRRALAGSSTYCAVKAGIDHFARTVALDEQARGERGVRIVALAPGVFESDMQRSLREADPAVFSNRDYFVGLQHTGQLLTPQAAAQRVLACLRSGDFGSNPVADVRGG